MTKFDTILFTIFIFLVPIFGKSLDSIESIIFYFIPIYFSISLLMSKDLIKSSKKPILYQLLLISALFINILFSRSIGFSYYSFFSILVSILIINISIAKINQKDFLKYLIIFSFIYSSVFLLNKLGFIQLNPKPMGDNFILQYWGHSILSDILIISIPLLIYQRVNPLLILFQIIVLILTNSRSSLFIMPFIICLIPKINLKQKIIYIITTIFGFLLFIFLIKFGLLQNKHIIGNRFEYWSQAISGFTQHPIIGNGLNTFHIVSNQNRTTLDQSSFTHNSLLNLLSDLGLPITILIIYFLIKRLKYQHKNNYLFFILSVSIIANSLFDASINTFSTIIILSYLLFKNENKSKNTLKTNNYLIPIITIFSLIHIVLRISSDFALYSKNNPDLAKKIDPFNINAYIKLKEDSFLFKDEELIYKNQLSNNFDISKSNIYNKVLELNPKDNCKIYIDYSKYYLQNNDINKLDEKISDIENKVLTKDLSYNCYTEISKIYYFRSQIAYKNNDFDNSINYIQKSINLIPSLSHFYIEKSNIIYHSTKDKIKAISIIEDCLKNNATQNHCNDYKNKVLNNNFDEPFSPSMLNFFINENIP